jgi:hypothetical protein
VAYTLGILPPGEYTFTIVGTDAAGTQIETTFTWTLIDPCQRADLFTLSPPSGGQPRLSPDDYSNNAFKFSYAAYSVTPSFCSIQVTCTSSSNPSAVPVQQLDGNGQLTFQFDQTDYSSGDVPPGTYTLTFEVKVDGAAAEETKQTFTVDVTLEDICDLPDSINLADLRAPIDYTLATAAITYTHPDAVVTPTFCLIDYSYEVPSLANGNSAISRTDKEFTVQYSADLTPLTQTPQTVKVIVQSRSPYATATKTPLKVEKTFQVNYLNPCINSSLVSI